MAEALGTSFDVGVSVFVFLVHDYMLLINNISGPKAMNGYKHRKLSLNSFIVAYKENKHIKFSHSFLVHQYMLS